MNGAVLLVLCSVLLLATSGVTWWSNRDRDPCPWRTTDRLAPLRRLGTGGPTAPGTKPPGGHVEVLAQRDSRRLSA